MPSQRFEPLVYVFPGRWACGEPGSCQIPTEILQTGRRRPVPFFGRKMEGFWPQPMERRFEALVKTILTGFMKVVVLEDQKGLPVESAQVFVHRERRFAHGIAGEESPGDYIPREMVRFSEPRILLIKEQLSHILGYCRLITGEGSPIQVGGFRLIARCWVVPYEESLMDNLGSLSSSCTCRCRFCYMDGNPYRSSTPFTMSPGEARLRARYFDPKKKRGLFPILREYLEPFANPKLLDILHIIRREQPEEYLTMMTNGSSLTPAVIEELKDLKPIDISISLNTVNPESRRRLMGDRTPHIAIESFHLLREAGIPFSGSIVASRELPLSELEETILFLDEQEAAGIRVVLPGYTRFHGPRARLNTPAFWPQVVNVIQRLRADLTNFLILQPNAYWMKTTGPFIDGVIKNSPAAWAGVQTGDLIIRINGFSIHDKAQAHKVLAAYSVRGKESFVEVERGGEKKSFTLHNNLPREAHYYPFKPAGYMCDLERMYGICLVESLRREYLIYLAGILRRCRCQHAVVFTSQLMQPQLQEELSRMDPAHYFGDCQVDFEVIHPSFWGGNIVLGDLTVVSDYTAHIQALKQEGRDFDLVVIPASFLVDWGRDYRGEVFQKIKRETGVDVELLPCKTINL